MYAFSVWVVEARNRSMIGWEVVVNLTNLANLFAVLVLVNMNYNAFRFY